MGCACTADKSALGKRYSLGRTLGHGAFGSVQKGRRRGSLTKVAVKVIYVLKEGGELDANRLQSIQKEAMLSSRVAGHEHCVKYLDFIREDPFCYLVMELCRSSLMREIRLRPMFVSTNFVLIFRQVLSAISYCHSKLVVHRDVKPENIMLGLSKTLTLKLCDFGLAETIPADGYLSGMYGTAPYMAPEMVCSKPYDAKVDVWSVGVVAYYTSFGRLPYAPNTSSVGEMKAAIRAGKPAPPFPTDKCGAFLQSLLERSSEDRCSSWEALQLKFIGSVTI